MSTTLSTLVYLASATGSQLVKDGGEAVKVATETNASPALTLAIAIIGGLLGAGGLAAIIKSSADARSKKIESDLEETKTLDARINRFISVMSAKIEEQEEDLRTQRKEQSTMRDRFDAMKSSFSSALSYIQELLRYIDEIAPAGSRQPPKPPRDIYEKLRESDEKPEDSPRHRSKDASDES